MILIDVLFEPQMENEINRKSGLSTITTNFIHITTQMRKLRRNLAY